MDTYRILADGQIVNNNTWQTGLNNNDLIVGPSGAGKTRGYVMPNILQCNESMVITDTKAALYSQFKDLLAQQGYKVICLDLANPVRSEWGYNPMMYVRCDEETGKCSEQDILTLAACLIPRTRANDPYWEISARIYTESLISYVLECLPPDECTLTSVANLLSEIGPDGNYKKLINELSAISPNSFAVNRYNLFKGIAEGVNVTNACIYGNAASHMSVLSFDGTKQLFENEKQIEIEKLGQEKTVVFLTVSDSDDSMYRLASLFYTQALHVLSDLADKSPGHRLKMPVRFYLDDFASNVVIPNFDKLISVIRSREIYVSVILQSLSQLESLYDHQKAMTIINNCDNCLYLGGTDVETAKYFAIKANKSVNTILNMPLDNAWLFTRGQEAKQVQKYNIKNHRYYDGLPESRQPEAAKEMQPQCGLY